MAQINFRETEPDLKGFIELPGFNEEFLSNPDIFDANAYRQQWQRTLQSVADGEDRVLITSWGPCPGKDAISGRGYVFYWVGADELAIQETLLVNEFFFDDPAQPSLDNLVVPERETEVDGDAVSEWTVSGNDIAGLIASFQ